MNEHISSLHSGKELGLGGVLYDLEPPFIHNDFTGGGRESGQAYHVNVTYFFLYVWGLE